MIRVILSGCNGQMGQAIAARAENQAEIEIVAGVDNAGDLRYAFPVFDRFDALDAQADMVIDFSHVSLTPSLLDYCKDKQLPLVLCTTGIAGDLEAKVMQTAKNIPIFQSFNMSVGVSLLRSLVHLAAKALGDTYDIEIIEKHHNQKVDAPSGTALMIAEAVASALPYEPVYVHDRSATHKKRDRQEIGIHAIRGGSIVGVHEVLFIGPQETISISHTAESRVLFATGAIKAAFFLASRQSPGLYNMDDLVQASLDA